MFAKNHYSMTEVVLYVSRRDPDGIWRVYAAKVIGHRKFINGIEVNDDGTPKDLKNATSS